MRVEILIEKMSLKSNGTQVVANLVRNRENHGVFSRNLAPDRAGSGIHYCAAPIARIALIMPITPSLTHSSNARQQMR